MDVLTALGIIGIVVGIVAGIVQVLDYLQKRRQSRRDRQQRNEAPEPVAPAPQEAISAAYLTQLRLRLTELFNENELRSLVFDLGVDYDNLPGRSKDEKARELVAYMQRNGRLPELVAVGRRLRPQVNWSEIDTGSLVASELPELTIPHNLPRRANFVGREPEKAQVHEALRSDSYLVSIDGIGGIGKSSLALEVAYECLFASKNGNVDRDATILVDGLVWTTAKDRELTLSSFLDIVARTLDYPGITQQPLADKVVAVQKLLQARRYLLIVDNFETITDEALLSFVVNVPEPTKVLITTREQKLHQARLVSLTGLTQPEALALIRSEGSRLGLRAVEQADDRTLLELFQVAGGAPLAIKWSVGQLRLRGQSLDAILTALQEARGDVFQQLFDRAWALLSADAHQVLIAMPLFEAPAPRSAIEAASGLQQARLDQALGQLVGMSLLDANDQLEENKRRYTLHPLTRAFAKAQLKRETVTDQMFWQQMANYYLDKVRGVSGREIEAEVLAFADDQLPNILAAIRWCASGSQRMFIEFVTAIFWYLYSRGHWDEAIVLGKQVYEQMNEAGMHEQAARDAVSRLSFLCRHRHELDQAEVWCKKGLAVFEGTGNQEEIVRAWRYLGRIYHEKGRLFQRAQQFSDMEEMFHLASEYYQQSLDYYRYETNGDKTSLAHTYLLQAKLAFDQGAFDEAREWALACFTLDREVSFTLGEAAAHLTLGGIELALQQVNQARTHFSEALAKYQQLGPADSIADANFGLAHVEAQSGNTSEATVLARQALDTYQRLGRIYQQEDVNNLLAKLSEQSPDEGVACG